MMQRYLIVLGVAAAAAFGAPVGEAGAQEGTVDPQCVGSGSLTDLATQDACQKAIDVFQFMAPQLGVSLTGGNSVLGEARSLGGLGHFSLGVRANGLRGRLPRVDQVPVAITGAVASDYPIKDQVIGLPAIDAAVGLVSGLDLGGIRILGVDALVNLAYVPDVSSNDFSIELPDGSLKVGLGARLTIFDEISALPSLSISFLERDLPTTTLRGVTNGDELAVRNLDVTTSAWRAMAGKTLGPLTFVVGGGKDSYDAGAAVEVTVNRGGNQFSTTGIDVSQTLSRTTYFADLSLNLPVVKLVAELGKVSGGTLSTYNHFGDKRADDDLQFASVGLRLRW